MGLLFVHHINSSGYSGPGTFPAASQPYHQASEQSEMFATQSHGHRLPAERILPRRIPETTKPEKASTGLAGSCLAEKEWTNQ